MSVEKSIVNELDVVLASIRRAEQNIIGKDSSAKVKVVSRLVDLEEIVKSIRSDITIPTLQTLEITEHTLIDELQREKVLSVRVINSLRRSGCKTIKDIISHTAYEISTMRSMGKKGTGEVIEFLRLNGFSPKQGSGQENE